MREQVGITGRREWGNTKGAGGVDTGHLSPRSSLCHARGRDSARGPGSPTNNRKASSNISTSNKQRWHQADLKSSVLIPFASSGSRSASWERAGSPLLPAWAQVGSLMEPDSPIHHRPAAFPFHLAAHPPSPGRRGGRWPAETSRCCLSVDGSASLGLGGWTPALSS